jgi:hypothetical protein
MAFVIYRDFDLYTPTDPARRMLVERHRIKFWKATCGTDFYDIVRNVPDGVYCVAVGPDREIQCAVRQGPDPRGGGYVERMGPPIGGGSFVTMTRADIPVVAVALGIGTQALITAIDDADAFRYL